MRTLATSLALSTALLGGMCVYLLWRAGDQAEHVHDGQLLQRRVDVLVAERERLRGEVTLARRSLPCDPAPSTDKLTIRAANVAGGSANPMPGARRVPGAGALEQLSPEHWTTIVRERYGRVLYRELSLSDAEVDALLPVLVAQDAGPGGPTVHFGPRDTPEARQRESEIAAVIGPEKAAQFVEERSNIPARIEVRSMREQLERAGAPLSDEQNAALSTVMKDLGFSKPPPPAPDATPQESVERTLAWRAARSKHVRDRVAPLLTPRQLQRWDEFESLRVATRMVPAIELLGSR